jgi:uncharacterized iron-regulated membrane protein
MSRRHTTGEPPAPGFRAAMDAVHTWAGVLFAALLFAIFMMGTLSVFDREIDRWAQPPTRQMHTGTDGPAVSLDAAVQQLQALAPPAATTWLLYPPSDRLPTLRIGWSGGGVEQRLRDLDASTGRLLPEAGAPLGTRLFFPFHYSLLWKWKDVGQWIVGAAAMAMLLAVVSGVATHRRLFKDFFTFRPAKRLQRASLDLHNVTAVFGLPFHVLIALSGLIVFASLYLQPAVEWVYGGKREAFNQQALSRYTRPPAREPLATRHSIDALAAQARAAWSTAGDDGRVGVVIVRHPHDANAVVEVRRNYDGRITLATDTRYFDAASGALLHAEQLQPVARTQRFIIGLHLIQFDHWTLRWLYFVMGAAGCVMVAAGSIAWVEKRRERHARLGRRGAALVEALTAAAVCGLPIAAVSALGASLLLPWSAADAMPPLASATRVFFAAWLACLAHALLQALVLPARRAPWREQSAVLAALALTAVGLNWWSSGDHLLRTLARGDWATACVDLGLLAVAALAARAGWRLRRASPAAASGPGPGWPRAAGEEPLR